MKNSLSPYLKIGACDCYIYGHEEREIKHHVQHLNGKLIDMKETVYSDHGPFSKVVNSGESIYRFTYQTDNQIKTGYVYFSLIGIKWHDNYQANKEDK